MEVERVLFLLLNNKMDVMLLTTAVASVGTLIAILFDKFKHSRCTKIVCCCCEIDRDVINE